MDCKSKKSLSIKKSKQQHSPLGKMRMEIFIKHGSSEYF
ncbi:hypothetical protein GYO_1315 [Bacillus spizizenii TU-B-10]|uniref:Uncharacterized protein n=1 Tax=Bacillus spizizenii (strain DSM 15029 / JCM 12233 / NBRC 101239 / NRRL B-23049 / TU-B-10) TaxID=1052585 RepID=G4NRR1_BACS4|nr:hypothetical protein GYO_1315 [Bacillus spizizenii TU-B-10]